MQYSYICVSYWLKNSSTYFDENKVVLIKCNVAYVYNTILFRNNMNENLKITITIYISVIDKFHTIF